jgi:hypothetical protein
VQKFRVIGKWSNENNVPYLCALENGLVKTHGYVFIVRNGRYFVALINDVIFRVAWSGLFTNIQKQSFDKQKLESKFNSHTFTDTYTAISISHLQTIFYLMLFGYVLAFISFMAEIMCHCCRS